MPIFFITGDQVQNGQLTIAGPLLNHLRTSLRVRVGEEIWFGDDQRRRYHVRVTRIDRRELTGRVLDTRTEPSPLHPSITVGQALLKGDRMDWVVQKTIELGVTSLVPLVSNRVIVRPRPGRLLSQQQRWQRIVLEAAQQSERWELPTIQAPCEVEAFFVGQSSSALRLILGERGQGESLATVRLPSGPENQVTLAVGPEGGWTAEELRLALDCGFTPVTLGTRILRSETATLAALAILQSRLGELG
ncbi:MAG: 16S rRNA (uracil(1498)-N(3))-methyltransferase [Nitrospiraceae bacterium]